MRSRSHSEKVQKHSASLEERALDGRLTPRVQIKYHFQVAIGVGRDNSERMGRVR